MSARNERRVAVEANVDPRTVRRVVEGRRVQPAIETAVRAAMRKCEAAAIPKDVTLRCGACGDETQAHEGAYSPKCSRCGGVRRVLGLDAEPAPREDAIR